MHDQHDKIRHAIRNLEDALVELTLRAAELDGMTVAEQVRFTYTDPAVGTFGWNEYRASLDQAIAAKTKAIGDLRALSWDGETVYSVVR